MLRLLGHRRLHLHLGAIGLDHHQASVLEKLLGIDPRLLGARLRNARLLDRRRRRRLIARLLMVRFFLPCLLRARLELVDATLLLRQRCRCGGVLLARTIAAIAPIAAIAVAVTAAAIAASAAVLFAFALRTGTLALAVTLDLRLAFARKLMKLRRLAT